MTRLLLVVLLGGVGVLGVGCSGASTGQDGGCPSSYCNSNGACAEVDGLPLCTCDEGYEGLTCVTCASGFHRVGTGTCTADQVCETSTCGSHGQCSVVRGEIVCACEAGYDGPRCETCYGEFVDIADAGQLDAGVGSRAQCVLPMRCNAGSCGAGFECDDSAGSISCVCNQTSCEPSCTETSCSGHGACDDSTGSARCSCDVGYEGARCNSCYPGFRAAAAGPDAGSTCVPADRCTANACSGGGQCFLDAGVAQCRCDAEYEGGACERCASGFHRSPSGSCEADQTCEPTSCGPKSSCVVSGGVVGCPCNAGYAGIGCNQCYPGYHAESADGGAGINCVLDDRCTATSCGQGTCEDATGIVVCSGCPAGFSGSRCEVNNDDCGTACQSGQCVDLIGSRVCLCTDGTYGQTCLPGPAVTAVAPPSGPRDGGTVVTLTGSGFVAGSTVTVGGVAATSVSVSSATTMTFVVPASSSLGVVPVVVRAPNAQVARAQYAYAPLGFGFTGAPQRFTVPAGVSSLTVHLWGAAGGAGDVQGIRGGAGGYSTGTLSVDAGQEFIVVVGQGGARWFGLADDGGVADSGTGAGAGGGFSGLFMGTADAGYSQATALLLAGGGGGGGRYINVAYGSSGGNGGGDFGGAGAVAGTTSFDARGQGGSPTAGGVGGCSTTSLGQCGQSGLALQGGGGGVASLNVARVGATFGGGGGVGRTAPFNAGGGGGGYFGGGGGANETAQGGGGGSGFAASVVHNGVLVRGTTPGIPEGREVVGYAEGVAIGGGVDGGVAGGHGLILIAW